MAKPTKHPLPSAAYNTAAVASPVAAVPRPPRQKRAAARFAAVCALSLCLGGCKVGGAEDVAAAPSPTPGASPTAQASGCLPWSAPASWGGVLPTEDAQVVIPLGKCIQMDTDPPRLASVTIYGTLAFADNGDRALRAGYILVQGGALEIGTPTSAFQHNATITLDATDTQAHAAQGMGTRALLVMDGRLALYGKHPATAWTRLDAHASAGATALTLAQAVADWAPNDPVVVAPTDFYGVAQTDSRILAGVSADGLGVTLSAGLSAPRWGRLQYPAPLLAAGLSQSPADYTPPAAPAPLFLDQRAEVGNLRRGIVIQGVDDALWQNTGFGAHTMVMGLGSQVVVDGVHFRRSGQAGRTGRYPFHWHMLSYGSGGGLLGDATGHVLRNSVISGSSNRCVTIHGTNGVQVANNICHNIRGHAIFMEDAVERRNTIEDNLILEVRSPLPGMGLLNHEVPGTGPRAGSSGMWLTNPDNTVRRNAVADIAGNGYWLAFPRTSIGHADSIAANLRPRHMAFGVFQDNVAHSLNHAAVLLDLPPVSTPPHSNTEDLQYRPTTDMLDYHSANALVPYSIRGLTLYKSREGLWNRQNGATFEQVVSADNTSRFFAGSSAASSIRRSLVVGTSLNNATTWLNLLNDAGPAYQAFRATNVVQPPSAFASYHGGVAALQNTVINMPYVALASLPAASQWTSAGSMPSGVFATDDYYIRPVERSLVQNQNNLLIHSSPGIRSLPRYANFQFAGTVVDYEGLLGPAGNNWVFDTPFLTYPQGCVPVTPAGQNGQSCNGSYFGAQAFVLDNANEEYYPLMRLEVSRREQGLAANTDVEVGNWVVSGVLPANANATLLPNMRHFAMRQNGVYVLRFPEYANALSDVRMVVGNMHLGTDTVVLAVHFRGSNPHVFASTHPTAGRGTGTGPVHPAFLGAGFVSGSTRSYSALASHAELLASAGDSYYFDDAADLVWIKLRGGIADAYVSDPGQPFSDEALYQPFWLRIRQ